MTNEQHIENLKKLKSFHNGSYGAAINAAINALKHEQALGEAFNIALLYGKEKGMEAIDKALYQMGMDGLKEQEIEALVEQEPKWIQPPVTPQPKTGHWIEHEIENTLKWLECSNCHCETSYKVMHNYCPNCGAKMEVSE